MTNVKGGWKKWWRPVRWSLSLIWAGFWVVGGLGTGFDPTDGTGLVAGIGLAIAFGIVPMIPLWMSWSSDWRKARKQARVDKKRIVDEVHALRLPKRLRKPWERLLAAENLVGSLAAKGWIEKRSLVQLTDEVKRLESLAVAANQTDLLGGRPADSVYGQVQELTDLLVALADEAIDHQAVVAQDGPVAANLAEARDRLMYSSSAYQELSGLVGDSEQEDESPRQTNLDG